MVRIDGRHLYLLSHPDSPHPAFYVRFGGLNSGFKLVQDEYPSLFSVAMIKYSKKSLLGKKGLIWLALPHHSPSLREVTQELKE